MRIGFLSTRLAGTDGVSLETRKWAKVTQRLGHQVFFCAGQLDDDVPNLACRSCRSGVELAVGKPAHRVGQAAQNVVQGAFAVGQPHHRRIDVIAGEHRGGRLDRRVHGADHE